MTSKSVSSFEMISSAPARRPNFTKPPRLSGIKALLLVSSISSPPVANLLLSSRDTMSLLSRVTTSRSRRSKRWQCGQSPRDSSQSNSLAHTSEAQHCMVSGHEGPNSRLQLLFLARSQGETVPPAPFLAVAAHARCVWSSVVY